MNSEDRFKITSDDFADLVIEYNNDINLLEQFTDGSYNIINNQFAVVHIPAESMSSNSISKFNYNYIPKCYGLMSSLSMDSSGITAFRRIPDCEFYGSEVLIGIVDTGIDYTNHAFRNPDNSSRIVSIWDQTIESDNYPEGYYYGTVYDRNIINYALAQEDPTSIVPSTDEIGHGTTLAAIAGGSPCNNYDFTGVASGCKYAVVKLKEAKASLREFFQIPNSAPCYQSNDIMFGIRYLIEVAQSLGRPMAICIGLGTSQGSHQGLNNVDRFIMSLSRIPGFGFLTAAGNEGYLGHHYAGLIEPGFEQDEFVLNVGGGERGFSMELWGFAPYNYTVDIYSPSGEFVGSVPNSLPQTATLEFFSNGTTLYADNVIHNKHTGDHLIIFRFFNPTSGSWRFRVAGQNDLRTEYDVWLPIRNFLTSNTFLYDSTPYVTLTGISTAEVPIAITAYSPFDQTLYENASRGFTRNRLPKPDVAAPGVNILAPTIGNEFVVATGTGVATAHATGAVALLLEWGFLRGNLTSMNNYDIRKLLTSGAARDPNLFYPNPDWGFGKLNLHSTFENTFAYTIPSINAFFI